MSKTKPLPKDLQVKTFDYEGIDPDVKGKLIWLAGEINRSGRSHVEHALKMGEAIRDAHALLAGGGCEGRFKPWIETECGISRSTAYNYMWAFERFGKAPNVIHFTNEGMYLLSPPTIPTAAVKEAEHLASKGVRISADLAKEIVAKFKAAQERVSAVVNTQGDSCLPRSLNASPAVPVVDPPPPKPVPKLTPDERRLEWNRQIEIFARSITSIADNAPAGGWWDETQANIVGQQLKSAAGAARQAKCDNLCPICEGEGSHPKGSCDRCKGTGFMPKRTFEMVGK